MAEATRRHASLEKKRQEIVFKGAPLAPGFFGIRSMHPKTLSRTIIKPPKAINQITQETFKNHQTAQQIKLSLNIILRRLFLVAISSLVQVDEEILRGVSLRKTLRGFGRVWQFSPSDLPLKEREALWKLR